MQDLIGWVDLAIYRDHINASGRGQLQPGNCRSGSKDTGQWWFGLHSNPLPTKYRRASTAATHVILCACRRRNCSLPTQCRGLFLNLPDMVLQQSMFLHRNNSTILVVREFRNGLLRRGPGAAIDAANVEVALAFPDQGRMGDRLIRRDIVPNCLFLLEEHRNVQPVIIAGCQHTLVAGHNMIFCLMSEDACVSILLSLEH
eukprot:5306375-Amphidinium_carterae.4